MAASSSTSSPSFSKSDLCKDPLRVKFIKDHRKIRSDIIHFQTRNLTSTCAYECAFKFPKSDGVPEPEGFKPIFLKDMDLAKNHLHTGYFIELTIIDDPMFGLTAVNFVVEDGNKDVTVLSIYGIPHDSTTAEKYGFGTVIRIVNPFIRTSPLDGRWGLRVDDKRTVTVVTKKDDMCRFCGAENAPKRCADCKRLYCDRKCQVLDWKMLDHKLTCPTPSS